MLKISLKSVNIAMEYKQLKIVKMAAFHEIGSMIIINRKIFMYWNIIRI